MFSRKSKIYQEIESDLILELHRQGLTNLKLNIKFRIICILVMFLSLATPWYLEPFQNKSIYLYMICDQNLYPSNCSTYYTLNQSCNYSSAICSESKTNMKAGLMVFFCSFLSLLSHLISFYATNSILNSRQSYFFIIFIYLSSFFFISGCVLWTIFSVFEPRQDLASYGLMITFSAIFMNLFVSFHFHTFKGFIVEYYPYSKSSSSHSSSSGKSDQ